MKSKIDGAALVALRHEKYPGLTQDAAAERMGIPQTTLSSYERGAKVPGWDNIGKLCDFYGLTLPEFKERVIVVVSDASDEKVA